MLLILSLLIHYGHQLKTWMNRLAQQTTPFVSTKYRQSQQQQQRQKKYTLKHQLTKECYSQRENLWIATNALYVDAWLCLATTHPIERTTVQKLMFSTPYTLWFRPSPFKRFPFCTHFFLLPVIVSDRMVSFSSIYPFSLPAWAFALFSISFSYIAVSYTHRCHCLLDGFSSTFIPFHENSKKSIQF